MFSQRNFRWIITGCLCFLLSCEESNKEAGSADNNKNKGNMQEGKDYVLLKRFRVEDRQGFNQPVEVSSFLLPANWKVNAGVQWNATNKCIAEIVQAGVQATSPENAFELFFLPVTQFDWSDDPVYLDAMQRGFNMHSCSIAQPLDAAGYISKGLASAVNAKVKSTSIISALQAAMDQGARQMTNMARQAGNNAYTHRGSAAEGVLQFSDGKEGIALCTIMQTITTMPGTQGGMSNTYQCYVSMRVVMKYEAGKEEMARKLLSTFMGSGRINPQWSSAVQSVLSAIGRNAQIELGKQIEITRQAQEEISNGIIRNWEKNSNKSNSDDFQQQFSQYLRGVDSWTDEGGNKVELTNGYTNAWSKGDGTYILSNNPAFDPSVEFKEDWKRLNR